MANISDFNLKISISVLVSSQNNVCYSLKDYVLFNNWHNVIQAIRKVFQKC